MCRRTFLLALCCLLVATTGCSSPLFGGPPDVTLTNEDEQTYRVVIYTVEADHYEDLQFRVTVDGTRQTAGFRSMYHGGVSRNARLADEGVTPRTVEVAPHSTVDVTLDSWSFGESTVYIIETPDGRLVSSDFIECTAGGQEHTKTIVTEDQFHGSSSC